MLRAEDFIVWTLYDEYGDAEGKIADHVIIADCGFKGRVLLTGDKDLVFTWAKEIVDAKIAVFVTTSNNEGPKFWGPIIIKAKSDILRELRLRETPFTARISSEGRITQVRTHDGTQWKTITIGRKNPPHVNRQK
jgi:hypothetical protein